MQYFYLFCVFLLNNFAKLILAKPEPTILQKLLYFSYDYKPKLIFGEPQTVSINEGL